MAAVGPRRAPGSCCFRDYLAVADPIIDFIEARRPEGQRVVVLIPTVLPSRVRYRILHNQFDRVLTNALRRRPEIVVARVYMELDDPGPGRGGHDGTPPGVGDREQATLIPYGEGDPVADDERTDERTEVSEATRKEQAEEGWAAHQADRGPTPEEEAAAAGDEVDEDVAAHERDMAERGANVKGEGEI